MAATVEVGDDGYFNDLSRQPTASSGSPDDSQKSALGSTNKSSNEAPKAKRVACVICRKRKLRCDGCRPSCGTCSRLGHDCAYDEVRRKSGPKRGYVKELEARLAQVETQLKSSDGGPRATAGNPELDSEPASFLKTVPEMSAFDMTGSVSMDGIMNDFSIDPMQLKGNPGSLGVPGLGLSSDENLSWEMIGLGLEEPLPPQEAIDELTALYFEKIHDSMPMIHRQRYFLSMNLAPYMRPAVCLRYAMWANAASVSDKYLDAKELFYRRARKYIDLDEMKGHGEGMVSLAHSQAWTLISCFEFKHMYFPRAWMSAGRSVRLAQMMGLNRIDGIGLDVKQVLQPARDWVEKEERRRTFWSAYCTDRFASTGTGWPMTIDERDIMTNLPAHDEAYQTSMEQPTMSLEAAMTPEGAANLGSFAGLIVMAHFFGTNLNHLHRPSPDEREDDLQGEFWKRHRNLDNVLLHKALSLPQHLRLPFAVRDSNAVFINMAIHTSTICLHQAAIFKAEKNNLPESLVQQSQNRCVLAAAEISSAVRMISHIDTRSMNPYLPFCLYVSARVFVQYLRKVGQDSTVQQSLEFLFSVMTAIKRHNPLAESFLVQLALDIEGSGLDTLLHNPDISSASLKGVSPVFSNRDCGFPSQEQNSLKSRSGSTPGTGTTPSADTDIFNDTDCFRAPAFNNVSLPTRSSSNGYFLKNSSPMYPHNRSETGLGQPPKDDGWRTTMFQSDKQTSPSSLDNPPTRFTRQDSSNTPLSTTGTPPNFPNPETTNSMSSQISDANTYPNYPTSFDTSSALPSTAHMTWAYGASSMGPPPTTSVGASSTSSTAHSQTTGMTPQPTGVGFTPGPTGMTPGHSGMTPPPPSGMDLPSPRSTQWSQIMDSLTETAEFQMPDGWDQGGVQ